MPLHMVGDSTLDNLYWVGNNRGKSVEGKLKEKCSDLEVNNFAFDGFRTTDVLAKDESVCIKVGQVLGCYQGYMCARGHSGGHVKPLQLLSTAIKESDKKRHYVLLSVGGNDFRENIANPKKFIGDIPKIQKRYKEIIANIKMIGDNSKEVVPIIMLQYMTDKNEDGYFINKLMAVIGVASLVSQVVGALFIAGAIAVLFAGPVGFVVAPFLVAAGVACLYAGTRLASPKTVVEVLGKKDIGLLTFQKILKKFYRPILELAKANNIPVLDMPNTMNPWNGKLYRSQIEPSEEGGNLIATGVQAIIEDIKNKKIDKIESKLYATNFKGSENFISVENDPKKYQTHYPKKQST